MGDPEVQVIQPMTPGQQRRFNPEEALRMDQERRARIKYVHSGKKIWYCYEPLIPMEKACGTRPDIKCIG
jgi:hypothetical protein